MTADKLLLILLKGAKLFYNGVSGIYDKGFLSLVIVIPEDIAVDTVHIVDTALIFIYGNDSGSTCSFERLSLDTELFHAESIFEKLNKLVIIRLSFSVALFIFGTENLFNFRVNSYKFDILFLVFKVGNKMGVDIMLKNYCIEVIVLKELDILSLNISA